MRIGLFPLPVIVFPGSAIPLHIFEDRYKALINDCWREKKPFGITLQNNGKIFDIGCMAEVADIMTRYEDGKLDIVVIGGKRFKMRNFSSGEKPYHIADVDIYEDEFNDLQRDKLVPVVNLFNKIADTVTSAGIKKINIHELDSEKPSFQIALKAGLTLEQKQKLIEIRSEKLRLELLDNHLKTLNLIVEEADIVNKIIKNDGYLTPSEMK